MDLDTLSAPLEIKLAGSADAGEFEGYGAFFGNEDSHGDTIVPGAFMATLAERKAAGRPLPPMHFNHGLPQLGGERGVGVWKAVSEDSRGLYVKGRLSGMSTDRGRYLFERLKDGAIGGMSIGYQIRPNGSETVAGRRGRRLKSIALAEISIVDEPSNALARVEAVKLAGIGDLEDLLRRGGLSRSAARTLAAGGWPALSGEPAPPDPNEHKAAQAAALGSLDRILTRNLSELKAFTR
ncbi:MAG: HK97 family phage prohead protease [Methylorubrum rhodinum]|uniref:HK97 family phage prohead protease n=1 Tax=Methylorubrum rhodinum TaxID=29428 RepID=UPI003BAF82B1